MDPVVGSVAVALIQAVVAALKQLGMDEAEASKYFRDSFQGVQDRPPAALPDAEE